MKISGYEITIDKIQEGTAKGQWRGRVNGKTIAVSKSKRAVMNNAEFLAKNMTPAMFNALVSPIDSAA